MATLAAIGVLFISAGPLFAMWLVLLQRRGHLLVISILSAFAWCLGMMIASGIWFAIPPLKQIFPWVLFVSVSMQELTRFGLHFGFKSISRIGNNVNAFLRPGVKDEFRTSVSVGVGFGFMSVAVNFYSLVADGFSNDTAVYVEQCPINFFVAGAGFALAFYLLHVLLAIIVWPAYLNEMGWVLVGVSYLLHLGVSEATLLNRMENGCGRGLALVWCLVALIFVFTVLLTRRRLRTDL